MIENSSLGNVLAQWIEEEYTRRIASGKDEVTITVDSVVHAYKDAKKWNNWNTEQCHAWFIKWFEDIWKKASSFAPEIGLNSEAHSLMGIVQGWYLLLSWKDEELWKRGFFHPYKALGRIWIDFHGREERISRLVEYILMQGEDKRVECFSWRRLWNEAQEERIFPFMMTNKLDSTKLEGTQVRNTLQEFLGRAIQSTLSLEEQQTCIEWIQRSGFNSCIFSKNCVAPSSLTNLIVYNPKIAVEYLLNIIAETAMMKEYLDVLMSLEMTLNSMDVIFQLISRAKIPLDWIYMYIVHGMEECKHINDRFIEARRVQLLCMFIQSIFRQDHIMIPLLFVHDLLVQLEAFCIHYSNVREAAHLFRLLKQFKT